jgi:hypothetical protein
VCHCGKETLASIPATPQNSKREVSCQCVFIAGDPSEINGGNLNNAKREASRHLRNKKRIFERQN